MLNNFCHRQHERSFHYFTELRTDIARKNLLMLHRLNLCAVLLLILYSLTTAFIFRQPFLIGIYCVFLIVHIILSVAVNRLRKQPVSIFRTVQLLCLLFILSIMSFIIIISVFPFPDRPAIFFPIFLLLFCMPFIFSYLQFVILATGFEGIFVLLTIFFKTPACYGYDLFGSITAWLLSLLITYFLLDLHMREGEAVLALQMASNSDVTTGLPNRRSFNEHFDNSYSQCVATNSAVAILLIDIDDFKSYNDHFGHMEVDNCLLKIGHALNAYMTENNIFIARFGGEEFVAVLKKDKAKAARDHANGIRECIASCAIKTTGSVTPYVTVSIGISVNEHPRSGYGLNLVREADNGLYLAKSQGKNQIIMYREQAIQ